MNPSQQQIEAWAERLRRAEVDRVPIAPLRDELPADDGVTAYAVQQANIAHGQARGRRVVGRKIGLTSPAVQRQLGVGLLQLRFALLVDHLVLPAVDGLRQ